MPILLDASPVIFLGKLDAFDVFSPARPGLLAPSVVSEVVRPPLAYQFPEVLVVQRAMDAGLVARVELEEDDERSIHELGGQTSGLHRGELGVLALARRLGHSVCIHERAGLRLAAALGLRTVHVVELLLHSTPDPKLRVARLRRFARLTNLAGDQLQELLDLARRNQS